MTKYEQQIKAAAETLKQVVGQPEQGVHLYTILRSVSRSGMMRHIGLYTIKDNQPICLHGDIRAQGVGMDMGFSVAYSVFTEAYGFDDDNYRYQDKLVQRWL